MIDPINIIQGEVYGLISNLKLNSRWSNSSYQDTIFPENPILRSLKNLTNILHNVSDFKNLDTCIYLEPFLSVIKSNQTSGFITGAALTSVNKFLNLFINEESNNIHKGIRDIAESAAHCKFEATDARSDEIVLMKILQVLLSCVKNPAGIYISNELVYEVTIACYHMSDQSRSSELLKKNAENSVQEIVSTIFNRFNIYTSPPQPPIAPPPPTTPSTITPSTTTPSTTAVTTEPTPTDDITTIAPPPLEVDFSPNNDLFFSNLPTVDETSANTDTISASITTTTTPVVAAVTQQPVSTVVTPPTPVVVINPRGVRFDSSSQTDKPYDETVLIRLFKLFVNNINTSSQDDMTTKLLCLNLVNTIIQIRGSQLEEIPKILKIIQQELFRYLLLNLQMKNVQIYSLSMRIFFNLFISLKRTLKSQFEAFFNVLMVSIQDNNRNHYELQELALEGLRDFCKLPHTMIDLFINYDCELHCSNVFENLCKFLYKNSFPISQPLTSLHLISFENLLSIVQSIEDRRTRSVFLAQQQPNTVITTSPPPQQQTQQPKIDYLKRKEHKRQLVIAAEHFNRNPKDAFEYLKNNNLYTPLTDASNVARFLLEVPKLNKTMVGEYLGKRGEFNEKVRLEYISSFNLKNPNCMAIFREFLESFKIPGDSAVVQIIFEQFAQLIYDNRSDKLFENADKVYLYIYSGLMLHTSLFNPSIPNKDRMKFSAFKLMLNKELPEELIQECFNDISENELIAEEEPIPGVINSPNWRNILKRSKRIGDYKPANTNDYDREIFSIVLNLVIPAISKVFEKIENESLCQRILDGFHLCAQVSANYNIIEVIDNLMTSLCNNTTLIDNNSDNNTNSQNSNNNNNNNNNNSQNSNNNLNNSNPIPNSTLSTLNSNNNNNSLNNSNNSLVNSNGINRDNNEHVFIGDNKAQLATIATFEIAIKYSNLLGESWRYIIAIICKLNKMDLLPNIFEAIDFPIDNSTTTKGNKKQEEKSKSNNGGSTFLSFRWFVADSSEYEETEIIDPYKEKAKTCIDNCHIPDLFQETKTLPMHSLDQLLNSLFIITNPSKSNNISYISSSPSNTTATTISQNITNSPNSSNSNNFYYSINQKQELFCFDLLSHIILLNQDRLGLVWKKYFDHCESIINTFEQVVSVSTANAKLMTPLIEKIVVSLMYLLIRLLSKKEVFETLFPCVKLLLRVGSVLDSIAEKMSISLIQLVQQNIEFISSTPKAWEPIIAIIMLLSGNPKSSNRACEALSLMIKTQSNSLTAETCEHCLEPINCFINSKTIPHSVVVKSMELLYYIFNSIVRVLDIQKIGESGDNPSSNSGSGMVGYHTTRILIRKMDSKITLAWEKFWLPILEKFASLCLDPKPDIRNNAMTFLQKTILSQSLEEFLSPGRWFNCFVDVVFPLLTNLKDAKDANFEDTRLRASALLSKVFLQNLNTIIKCNQFTTLWEYILFHLKIYMGLSELLSESVPESLKNMLLVMNNCGVFKPPLNNHNIANKNNQDDSEEDEEDEETKQEIISRKLWDLTWAAINEFCPKISEDVLSRVDPNNLLQKEKEQQEQQQLLLQQQQQEQQLSLLQQQQQEQQQQPTQNEQSSQSQQTNEQQDVVVEETPSNVLLSIPMMPIIPNSNLNNK